MSWIRFQKHFWNIPEPFKIKRPNEELDIRKDYQILKILDFSIWGVESQKLLKESETVPVATVSSPTSGEASTEKGYWKVGVFWGQVKALHKEISQEYIRATPFKTPSKSRYINWIGLLWLGRLQEERVGNQSSHITFDLQSVPAYGIYWGKCDLEIGDRPTHDWLI